MHKATLELFAPVEELLKEPLIAGGSSYPVGFFLCKREIDAIARILTTYAPRTYNELNDLDLIGIASAMGVNDSEGFICRCNALGIGKQESCGDDLIIPDHWKGIDER